MSDGTKISELPIAKSLGLTSVVPVVSEGETGRVTVKDIVTLTPPVDASTLIADGANNALTHDDGLKVLVSQDEQNELFYLDPKVSDKPGLYSRPISAMLFPIDESVTKQSSYQGNPKNSGIGVKISSRAGNELQLIKASESAKEQGLYVGPIRLTATTDLNTVTTTGFYIAPGGESAQGSYKMNYPFGVQPGSDIPLTVSTDADGTTTQSILCSWMASAPGPWVRTRTSSGWGRWGRSIDSVTFENQGVRQVNYSQSGLQVHKPSGQISSVWYYSAPDGTTSKPNPKTTPTANEGVALALTSPNSKPMQGVFGGIVFAVDSDGRAFTNVDRKNPGTAEAPSDLNWRELVSVHINSLQDIPDATATTQVETLNKILAVMRDTGMIKSVIK